ncbi:MAG: hypothetical protein JNM33_10160 [Rubrivivax sp.]|nr:hypothetical protein [Rubrivivax sp.]
MNPHRRRLLASMPLALPLAGCGGVFDDLVAACVDWDGPEFTTGSALPAATVGRAYSTTVEVRIVREPYDDYFRYAFRLRGSLPPGLAWRQLSPSRRVEVYGTPGGAGGYAFSFEVSVSDPVASPTAPPTLCWTGTERSFTLGVNP